jgi:inhibitor of cysteine peptidase
MKLMQKGLSFMMALIILIGGVSMRGTKININSDVSNLLRVGTKENFESLIKNVWDLDLKRPSILAREESVTTNANAPKDFVGTNEQVAGVAEGDVVKTDGNNIFYAPRLSNKIEILTVGNDKTISNKRTLKLEGIRAEDIYITDNKIVVVGYTYDQEADETLRAWGGFYWWYDQTASIKVYNRETLAEEYSLNTNTSILHHRMIDNKIYFVAQKNVYGFGYVRDEKSDNEDVRPFLEEKIGMTSTKEYVDYNDLYYFENVEFSNIALFITLDVETKDSSHSGFLTNVDTLYMNTKSLYAIGSFYTFDPLELSSWVTDSKLMVMKFDIGDELAFRASSVLTGTIVNQFSMDEHEDKFRIALTNSMWTPNRDLEVKNNIYILEEDPNTEILITSAVSPDLGEPGETIKSVRFTGNIARVVTFLQTDPLYTVDLADNFKIISEIKEPGFSTYMHDWGNDFVVGLGYAADDSGRVTGIKISAYRTDMGATQPVQTVIFDNEAFTGWRWSYSEALHNHKAILVSPEKNLIGFPVSTTRVSVTEGEKENWTFEPYYILFDVNFANLPMPLQMISTLGHGENDHNYTIDRGIYIDGVVYTLSPKKVMGYVIETGEVQEPVLFE